jgi:hypothetical protein
MARIIVIISLMFCVFAFKLNDGGKQIDAYKNAIDKQFEHNELDFKKVDHKSDICGSIKGYYVNKKLVLMKTCSNGDFGFHSFDFYIKNDSLLLVCEQQRDIKIPAKQEDFEVYVKKHTDKKGNTDMSKLPLSICDDNIFYLSDNHIVDAKLKQFNKPKTGLENEIAQKNKMIVLIYNEATQELK